MLRKSERPDPPVELAVALERLVITFDRSPVRKAEPAGRSIEVCHFPFDVQVSTSILTADGRRRCSIVASHILEEAVQVGSVARRHAPVQPVNNKQGCTHRGGNP